MKYEIKAEQLDKIIAKQEKINKAISIGIDLLLSSIGTEIMNDNDIDSEIIHDAVIRLRKLAALEQESKEQKIKDKCSKIYGKIKEAMTPDKRTFEQAEQEGKEHTTCDGCQMFAECGCMLDDSCPECVDRNMWISEEQINKRVSDAYTELSHHYMLVVDDIKAAISNYIDGKFKQQGKELSAEEKEMPCKSYIDKLQLCSKEIKYIETLYGIGLEDFETALNPLHYLEAMQQYASQQREPVRGEEIRKFICHKFDIKNDKRKGTWKWDDVCKEDFGRSSITEVVGWLQEYAQQSRKEELIKYEIAQNTVGGKLHGSKERIIEVLEKYSEPGRTKHHIIYSDNFEVIADELQAKELSEMHLNMQYYMEYCKFKGYATPQDWLEKHKHF